MFPSGLLSPTLLMLFRWKHVQWGRMVAKAKILWAWGWCRPSSLPQVSMILRDPQVSLIKATIQCAVRLVQHLKGLFSAMLWWDLKCTLAIPPTGLLGNLWWEGGEKGSPVKSTQASITNLKSCLTSAAGQKPAQLGQHSVCLCVEICWTSKVWGLFSFFLFFSNYSMRYVTSHWQCNSSAITPALLHPEPATCSLLH